MNKELEEGEEQQVQAYSYEKSERYLRDDFHIEHMRVDDELARGRMFEHLDHGSTYGLRRMYYFCDECQIGWGDYAPFKLIHFKHNGLNYGVPRPIKGLMPACPDCQKRDHVHKLNRYKKKKYTAEEKARLNAEYGRSAKIYTGEDNDKDNR